MAKIHDYQLHSIEQFMKKTDYIFEDDILREYKVSELDDLKAADYEEIMDNLYTWYADETSIVIPKTWRI